LGIPHFPGDTGPERLGGRIVFLLLLWHDWMSSLTQRSERSWSGSSPPLSQHNAAVIDWVCTVLVITHSVQEPNPLWIPGMVGREFVL